MPPFISSILSVPSLARLPKSPIVFSISATDSWSASRIDRHDEAVAARETATEMSA